MASPTEHGQEDSWQHEVWHKGRGMNPIKSNQMY